MHLVAGDRTTMEAGVIADTEQHDRMEALFYEVVNLPSEKREAFLVTIDKENREMKLFECWEHRTLSTSRSHLDRT